MFEHPEEIGTQEFGNLRIRETARDQPRNQQVDALNAVVVGVLDRLVSPWAVVDKFGRGLPGELRVALEYVTAYPDMVGTYKLG